MKKKSDNETKSSCEEDATSEENDDDELSTQSQEEEEDGNDNSQSLDSSLVSETASTPTSTPISRFGGYSSRGRGTPNNYHRLIYDHDYSSGGGKMRPVCSPDTVSTTSLSHFDGNSSTGTMSPNFIGDNQNHPRRSRRRPPISSDLFNRQLIILSSSTGASFVLFLFFYLNIFAFTALMAFAVSMFMLVYTSYAYIIYLVQSGELNIFTFLPQSLRDRMLNSSIHEMFTSPSDYRESRFLLLYFIPGLTPDQILQMVNRLPERHRDLFLGPGGLARMFFPSLVSSDNTMASERNLQAFQSPIVDAQMSDHSPLPVIEEGEEEPPEVDEVTNSDALRGIFDTARALITGEDYHEYEQIEEQDMYVEANQDDNQLADLTWDHVDRNEAEEEGRSHDSDDGSDESDLGLDINPDDMAGNLEESQLNRIARVIGIRRRRPTTNCPQNNSPPRTVTAGPLPLNTPQREITPPSAQEGTDAQRITEREQNIANEIMNDAVSTAIHNYYNIAMRNIAEAATNIVDSVTPSIISAGTRLSSLSGVGLLGVFSSTILSEYPISVMGRVFRARNLSEGRAGRYAIRGLLSTLTLGLVTIGAAYVTRSIVYRHRDAILHEGEDASKEHEDPSSPKIQEKKTT